MQLTRSLSSVTALLAVATLGLSACADTPTALMRRSTNASLALELSSADAAAGSRIGVAVRLDPSTKSVAGIQGSLRFDPARLAYVGQSATGATAIVGAQHAATGVLRLTSFDLDGLEGRVALLVFEVKGANYASSLAYDHMKASTNDGGLRPVGVSVLPSLVNRSVPVPADARAFSLADWKSEMVATGKEHSVSLRPGDLGTVGLKFGDINYDGAIGLDDYLGVAFAAVGLDEIIVGTDGPTRDVDLVMAGNVFPNNGSAGAPACGTNTDGSRVLDLDDYLAIAFYAVLLPTEPCVAQVIPGRGAATTLRDTLSGAELTVGNGQVLTLTRDRVWQIDGRLVVVDGGDLIIQAGTRIEANTAFNPSAVFIERGGQIFANGTQYQPIVFTCTGNEATKVSGCWAGLWINGRARINLGDAALGLSPDGCNQRNGEAGYALAFGGCNDADNSGSLTYAVIEFAGFLVNPNRELNCLTLAAVGSATTVNHVQCHGGLDDGVEFFGGNVSTSHLVLTGNNDDAFDVSFGLRGEHQFVLIQEDVGDAAGDTKGIEADGNEPAPGTIDLPRTAPKLFNFTIIGNLTARTPSQSVTQNAAIQIRRGAGVKIYNSVVAGWAIGLDLDDPLTCNTFGTGIPEIVATSWIEVGRLDNSDTSDPVCSGAANEDAFLRAGVGFQEITGGLGTQITTYFNDAYNTNLPDWRMRTDIAGNPLLGNTVTPASAGATAFVQATNYRGAVAPGLGGNIPWYSGWTRSFRTATTP